MALRIGFLLFRNVQQLDLTGPYEVLSLIPDAKIDLAAKTLDPVESSGGLILTPSVTFGRSPQFDIICVPGGAGVNQVLQDGEAISFVTAQAASARYVTSVCTGALILGAAGLLNGKRATTHWTCLDLLPAYGAEPVKQRVVQDGNLITGGGVTAGIDFGLALAAELAGRPFAECIQLGLEYAPAPPFDSGSPERAPKEARADALARSAKRTEERKKLAERYAAKHISD